MDSTRASERAFLGVSALLFAVGTSLTIALCASTSAMGETQMPGGSTPSMTWRRMPGQTWLGATAAFTAMWLVMMVAMMMPSLVPALGRYRRAVGSNNPDSSSLGRLTALAGAGYFFAWTVLGLATFALGVGLTSVVEQLPALARVGPLAAGVVVIAAGVLQLTAWKARQLACWAELPVHARPLAVDTNSAWRHGVRLGVHCMHCSAGLTASLLVLGVMDPRVMSVVAAAITLERVAPGGVRVARVVGVVGIVGGAILAVRTVGS